MSNSTQIFIASLISFVFLGFFKQWVAILSFIFAFTLGAWYMDKDPSIEDYDK